MEVYAVVIAAISAIVGVAGVIIAWVKAKKVYVCKDDFNKSTERAHTRTGIAPVLTGQRLASEKCLAVMEHPLQHIHRINIDDPLDLRRGFQC